MIVINLQYVFGFIASCSKIFSENVTYICVKLTLQPFRSELVDKVFSMTISVGYILYGNLKIINAFFYIHSIVYGYRSASIYGECKEISVDKCNFVMNFRMIAKTKSTLGRLEHIARLTLSVYWKCSYHALKQKQ